MSYTEDVEVDVPHDLIEALSKDVKEAAKLLDPQRARANVKLYYDIQRVRMRAGNVKRAHHETGRPDEIQDFMFRQMKVLEKRLVSVLDVWSSTRPESEWLRAQVGIGPILTAGLLSTFDPSKETSGKWMRFAGIDPSIEWNKGEKRPYSAFAKTLMWKCADSFLKQSWRDECFYGHLLVERKEKELEWDGRNIYSGEIVGDAIESHQRSAKEKLNQHITDAELKKISESGHLPLGRLENRAKRWTEKIFLAHFHEIAYWHHYGRRAPRPWVIEFGGHSTPILCPPPYPWPASEESHYNDKHERKGS